MLTRTRIKQHSMSLIGNFDALPDNSTSSLLVDQRSLLLVKSAGELFIYDNRCPHTGESLDPMGGSLASTDGLLIQCQRHAAEFVSSSGECVGGPCQGEQLQSIPFTLSGGDIYLD